MLAAKDRTYPEHCTEGERVLRNIWGMSRHWGPIRTTTETGRLRRLEGGSTNVSCWHASDQLAKGRAWLLCPVLQTSICSAMASASSTSIPR